MDYLWSILDCTTMDGLVWSGTKILSVVMAWIRLPRLVCYMYKHKILMEIGGLEGKVAKLDLNTDNRTKGWFTQLAVYVNLDRPLVGQILINGKLQRVEYEFLPIVSFHCGKYWHLKEVCPSKIVVHNFGKSQSSFETLLEVDNVTISDSKEIGKNYGP